MDHGSAGALDAGLGGAQKPDQGDPYDHGDGGAEGAPGATTHDNLLFMVGRWSWTMGQPVPWMPAWAALRSQIRAIPTIMAMAALRVRLVRRLMTTSSSWSAAGHGPWVSRNLGCRPGRRSEARSGRSLRSWRWRR